MNDSNSQRALLAQAGRLLLEYNESTKAIEDVLTATARALTGNDCAVAISYRGVAVSVAGEAPVLEPIRELRFNTALQSRVHEILGAVRNGEIEVEAGLTALRGVEANTPRHSRWTNAALLGAAAASFAVLLGADFGASAVAAFATALGLLARRELGRRHFSLLTLPFAAALIGAVLGGLAIRLGWTNTPELVLAVPALMLVPGPHIINGLLDLIDNYLPMCLARLGLAGGILIASATGIFLGAKLTLFEQVEIGAHTGPAHINLIGDAILAGIATTGFAVVFNTAWRHVWMAALGGMAGHGLRFLALEWGLPMETATLLGGLAVGMVSGWMVRSLKMPVAVIAFAGAVTMIPGLHIYRALVGAVRLARQGETADPALIAGTLGYAFQSCLVVFGLTLGLILGARVVLALTKSREPS